MPNDYFKFKQFTIHQDRCAMKVGTDATLLGAWAQAPTADESKSRVLDIGTGTGIIAIMMAQRYKNADIIGIDIDKEATIQATENAAESPWSDRITIIHTSLQLFNASPFDAIICNPPYFSNSLTSPDAKRTLSRHTNSLSYDELAYYSYNLLAINGKFSIIYPIDQRQCMESATILAGFFENRHCIIKTKNGKTPKRIMSTYTKIPHKAATIEELILNDETYQKLLSDFYL